MPTRSLMTTDELVEAVKRRAFLPNTQSALDDEDVIRFLNEELQDSVVPFLLSMHEEYLLSVENIPLAANTQAYKLPNRAVGRKLRDIKFIDTNNNPVEMSRIDPSDRAYFQAGNVYPNLAFYIQGDEIVIVAKMSASVSGSLQLMYYMKPGELVSDEECPNITAINSTTGQITLSSIPSNIVLGASIDFIEYKHGHRTLALEKTILAVDAINKIITIAVADVPSNLSVNDFVCSAETSPVPQIPDELHSLLAERAAARCLNSLGDVQGVQLSVAKIADLELKIGALIDNRIEGEPQKVNNMVGLLRLSKIGRRRVFY